MNRKFFLALALALVVVLGSLASAQAQPYRRPSYGPAPSNHGSGRSHTFPGSGHNGWGGSPSFPGSGPGFPGSGWGWQEGYFYLPDGTLVYGAYKVYSYGNEPFGGGFPANRGRRHSLR
jgi:hypothetical protein